MYPRVIALAHDDTSYALRDVDSEGKMMQTWINKYTIGIDLPVTNKIIMIVIFMFTTDILILLL